MYKVYWTNQSVNEPCASDFGNLSEALNWCQELRTAGETFVTMVSENPDSIGRPGVDAVVDGKLPDGSDYTWRKRR